MAAALAGVPRAPVDDIVDFYMASTREADVSLLDSAGQKPQYRCAMRPSCKLPRGFVDDTLMGLSGKRVIRCHVRLTHCLVIS